MRHGDEIQRRHTCEIGTQARIFSRTQVQHSADARLAQVRVHEDGFVAELRQGNREVRRGRCFAFARKRASHQNDLRRMIRLRQKQGCSKRTEGF